VTIQRSHEADPRKHRWPAMLCNEKQSFDSCLPLSGIILCLRPLSTPVAPSSPQSASAQPRIISGN
jgi:hypothetical protein